MGADFLYATAPMPYVQPMVRQLIERWCDEHDFHPDSLFDVYAQVGIERASRLDMEPSLLSDYEMQFEMLADDGDTIEDWVRAQVSEAVRTIVGPYRRDVSTIAFGAHAHYITGGMSWGDNPTEAFSHIEWLGSVDLFAQPITLAEARRALTALKEAS